MTRPGALEGLRVLDLAGPFGNYAGKLLCDLGADVVLAEPRSGAPTRRTEPLTADGESLTFTYQNAGKRSVVAEPGSATLRELVSGSDVVLGSGAANWPATWGLDLDALRSAFPRLVIVSVTPFGLTGPYAAWEGTDIVCLALGGLLALGGYGDGAPLQAAGEQALHSAQLFGAVGAMLAVLHAENTGEGQLVDTSAQETVSMALEHAIQYYDLEGTVRGRQIGRQRGAGAGLFECADGWVYLFVGGIASGRFWTRFTEWMCDEGVPGAEGLAEPRWLDRAYVESAEAKERFATLFEGYAASRAKEELYAAGQARGIPIAPVRSMSEVAASPQLAHRDYFRDVLTPSGRPVSAPGAPYRLSRTPWRVAGAAPALGSATGWAS
jgi:benzylsuccinate CoA-transferase BbsE subunit